jgi:hypothetical protein
MWHPIEIPKCAAGEVKKLVKGCCNNLDGLCVLLDCSCPQVAENKIVCRYFLSAVVPGNAVLNEAVAERGRVLSTKSCCECGKLFRANSNRQKYCPDCQRRVARKKAAERKRKSRAA